MVVAFWQAKTCNRTRVGGCNGCQGSNTLGLSTAEGSRWLGTGSQAERARPRGHGKQTTRYLAFELGENSKRKSPVKLLGQTRRPTTESSRTTRGNTPLHQLRTLNYTPRLEMVQKNVRKCKYCEQCEQRCFVNHSQGEVRRVGADRGGWEGDACRCSVASFPVHLCKLCCLPGPPTNAKCETWKACYYKWNAWVRHVFPSWTAATVQAAPTNEARGRMNNSAYMAPSEAEEWKSN